MTKVVGGFFLMVMALMVLAAWGWQGFFLFWGFVFVYRWGRLIGYQSWTHDHPGARQ
jgi:hypothetical protein